MNYKRKKFQSDKLAPKQEYRKPQVERGNYKASHIGVRHAAERANYSLVEWSLPQMDCE